MLAAAVCALLLAASGPSREALEAIVRAQTREASLAHEVTWQIKVKGSALTAKAIVVPPDRLQLFDFGVVPTEHVQVGEKAWSWE